MPSLGSSETWRATPTHLPAQRLPLAGDILRLVVEHDGELFRGLLVGRLLGDGDMVGKLGFAAQAAIGLIALVLSTSRPSVTASGFSGISADQPSARVVRPDICGSGGGHGTRSWKRRSS